MISKTFNEEQKLKIYQNIKKSLFILIDHYAEKNQTNQYFIINFKNTLIIINYSSISNLKALFSDNSNLPIYFLHESKALFKNLLNDDIPNQLLESDENLSSEIKSLSDEMIICPKLEESLYQLWCFIKANIAEYLIKEGYIKLIKNQNFILSTIPNNDDNNNLSNQKIWNEWEFIDLGVKGNGSSFYVELIYNINKEELFAIKKPNNTDAKTLEVIKREINNYSNINFPLLPKMYGQIQFNKIKIPIIQYIIGDLLSLLDTHEIHFTEDEKINIIFQIIMIIKYFHQNNFIYRDLKPNNIIIDANKTVFIFDFDRMIKSEDTIANNKICTKDFSSPYIAPEVNNGKSTFKSDIYSIGKLIYYIINEKIPLNQTNDLLFDIKNTKIQQIFSICTSDNIEQRPDILELLFYFISFFGPHINTSIFQNDPDIIYFQGLINYDHKYITKDIEKTLFYYKKAANLNDLQSQFNLGLIYFEGEHVNYDLIQAILYFTLAANQNDSRAQYNLGLIYSNNKYSSININKSINYYSKAANQNDPQAQYNLGVIYYEGKYIKRDINKSIHYFILSANQNYSQALYNLGIIFSNGLYIEKNIKKAIHYFMIAANQNHQLAQFNLGVLFYNGIYVERDVNKAINYFLLAANQNNAEAQFILGIIYNKGIYIDIKKAIHYYSLASKNNHQLAQFNLGIIYYEGKYLIRDIHKAIYYLSLAAKQKNLHAIYNLAVIYYEGKYVYRDLGKAIYYFKICAENNYSKAQFSIGVFYLNGIFYAQNFEKAIYYFKLAAEQNHRKALFNLGIIYYSFDYEKRDIQKSIHYFSLASVLNDPRAQNNLGVIYSEGEYKTHDIHKAIYYFTLAANQNHPQAQYNLGVINSNMKYIKLNIKKAIDFFTRAERQNLPEAQFLLGVIYYEGLYVKWDINKAIYYLQLAANQNHPEALFLLGKYYSKRSNFDQSELAIRYLFLSSCLHFPEAYYALGKLYLEYGSMHECAYWLLQAASKRCVKAYFYVGYLYHQGKYVTQNVDKMIHYYKEASTFNNKYAKNNLGVIYKNGLGEKIPPNIGISISYFEETIKRFKDKLSLYNLAHLYVYESKPRIDMAIELLKRSNFKYLEFRPNIHLLCIALILKHGFNVECIRKEINNYYYEDKILTTIGINNDQNISRQYYYYYYHHYYNVLKDTNYIYDIKHSEKPSYDLIPHKQTTMTFQSINKRIKNINSDFYEGLGEL